MRRRIHGEPLFDLGLVDFRPPVGPAPFISILKPRPPEQQPPYPTAPIEVDALLAVVAGIGWQLLPNAKTKSQPAYTIEVGAPAGSR